MIEPVEIFVEDEGVPLENTPEIIEEVDSIDLPGLTNVEVASSPQETEEAEEDVRVVEIVPVISTEQPQEIVQEEQTTQSSFRQEPSDDIKVWSAKRGSDLRKILGQWSSEERIEMLWQTEEDYVLEKDVFINGTFENAIEILFSIGLDDAPKYNLDAQPYQLVIKTKE